MGQPWYDYPVFQGNAYVTTYKGPGTDTPHYAYDIQDPFHTRLGSVLPGTVEVADYQPWGGEVFIKPDNPAYPEYYYYHLDEVDVKKGQHVGANQFIGLSGGENPGYPGAEHPAEPQWSSGPHTHLGWFTKWVSTPQGTRPYGPDTASLLQLAKQKGQGQVPLNSPFNPGNPGNPNTPSLPNLSLPTAQDLSRLGIGAAGVAIIAIGLISALHAVGATDKLGGAAKKLSKWAVLA